MLRICRRRRYCQPHRRTLYLFSYSGEVLSVTSRIQWVIAARTGLAAVLVALSVVALGSAAQADDVILPEPPAVTPVVTLPPAEPDPSPTVAPEVPAAEAPVDPPQSETPFATAPAEPAPAAVYRPAPAYQGPAPADVAAPAAPQLVLPSEEEAVDASQAPSEPTTPPTPAPEATPPSAAVAVAPVEPPAMGQTQIQSAVAVATGSSVAVQALTVLVLLAAGYAYFRFLGGRAPGVASRTRK